MRNTPTQLPSPKELFDIRARESQRKAVRYDFLSTNPDVYGAYRQVAQLAGVGTAWIDNYAAFELASLGEIVAVSTDTLAAYILSGNIPPELRDQLFDTLVVRDKLKPCDAIFVFGSPANARIAHAVELYKQGVAPLIIVTGKEPHYSTNELSEAERTAQFAIEHGVPESGIMIEPDSITLPDNVKRTLDMFELQQFQPRTICIVATSYIMCRAVMEWYKFAPWDMEIIAAPAEPQTPELHRDTWYQSDRGVRTLLNEYAKMVVEHKMDLIRKSNDR